LKELLQDALKHITMFDTIEYITLAKEDTALVATGIDVTKSVMVRVVYDDTVAGVENFDRFMCLGQLKFLKRVIEMDQVKDTGTVELIDGASFEGDEIYKGLLFKGKRVKIGYQAVDPKAVKGRNGRKYPQMVDVPASLSIPISPEAASEFKQMSTLQKMMVTKDATIFTTHTVDNNLVLRFPYNDNQIEMIMYENIDGFIDDGLIFESSIAEKAMNMATKSKSSMLNIGGVFMDIHAETDIGKYHIRIPKNSLVKRF